MSVTRCIKKRTAPRGPWKNPKGNQALTYSIGLITIDEIMLAGFAYGYINKLSYVYANNDYLYVLCISFLLHVSNGFNADELNWNVPL